MILSRIVQIVQRNVIVRHMHNVTKKTHVGLLGVPFDKGQGKSGVSLGPDAIRKGGLIQEIHEFNEWVDIKDYGNVNVQQPVYLNDIPPNMKNYAEVISVMEQVAQRVLNILNDQRICITLGGDHSMAFGSIDGHLKYNKNLAILWVDAHTDLNTNFTSATGNIHGMPVAILAEELEQFWPKLPGLECFEPTISLKNFVYIGLRSVDPLERLMASKYNVNIYGMEDIDKYGIVEVMKMALQNVDPNGEKSIHVSFDIDSLDPLEAPSTGTPVRGGLSLREGCYVMEEAYKTGRLKAIDLVEVNPTIGSLTDVKKTVDAAIQILKSACGTHRSGNHPINIVDIEAYLKDCFDKFCGIKATKSSS